MPTLGASFSPSNMGLYGNNFCLLSHLTGPLCFYEAWLLPCTLEKHEENMEISCGLGFPTELNLISSNSVVGCQSFLHFLLENVLSIFKVFEMSWTELYKARENCRSVNNILK